MTICEHCEGAGWQMFMLLGRPRFARCFICDGERTILMMMGAQPRPPLIADIVLSRRQNKWIRP